MLLILWNETIIFFNILNIIIAMILIIITYYIILKLIYNYPCKLDNYWNKINIELIKRFLIKIKNKLKL